MVHAREGRPLPGGVKLPFRQGSRQFHFELPTESEGGLFQKLKRNGRMVGGEQAVERGGGGLHAARQFRARHAAALHLTFDLPCHDTL